MLNGINLSSGKFKWDEWRWQRIWTLLSGGRNWKVRKDQINRRWNMERL